MRNSWYFLLLMIALTGVFAVVHYKTNFAYQVHTVLLLVGITYISRRLVNLQHIAVTMLLVVTSEYFIVQHLISLNSQGLPAFQTNALIFGTHFLVDLVMLLFLKYRVRFSLRYIRRTNPDNWRAIYMTHADPLLYGIFFAFVLVDLAAFGENIIRNLEYLGVDEAFAKQFWSWGLIYYNYEILKSILLSCVMTTLLATIFVERQRPDEAEPEFEAKP